MSRPLCLYSVKRSGRSGDIRDTQEAVECTDSDHPEAYGHYWVCDMPAAPPAKVDEGLQTSLEDVVPVTDDLVARPVDDARTGVAEDEDISDAFFPTLTGGEMLQLLKDEFDQGTIAAQDTMDA